MTGIYTCTRLIGNSCTLLFFSLWNFFFMAAPVAYGSSWARDGIQAAAVNYTAAVAMLDPLTHCNWAVD